MNLLLLRSKKIFLILFLLVLAVSVRAESCPIKTENLSRTNYSSKQGEVLALQMLLAKQSEIYPEGLMTGVFGPATERAVKKLQSDNGIQESGILDSDTIDLICTYHNVCPFQTLLLAKDAEETYEIKALQSLLTFLGYHTAGVTGIFGSQTEKSLKKYQIAKDIYDTGLVDYETQTELCKTYDNLGSVKPKITTTPSAPVSKALKVSCYASPNPVKTNQQVTFYSSVSGGTGSYSYY